MLFNYHVFIAKTSNSWANFLHKLTTMQLQSGPPLDEMSIACILRDLLHAIDYLHTEGKIHRDIKGFFLLHNLLNF